MLGLRVLVVLGAVCMSGRGQADPEVLRCSARGPDGWHEYRSTHFLVDTDVTGRKAEVLVKDLETMHALVLQALVGQQVEIPGRIRVVALGDTEKFREFVGGREMGGYQSRGSIRGSLLLPMIVLPAYQANTEMIAHELVHHLSWFFFPRQPTWFSEGLAGFVQTVARHDDGAVALPGSHVVRGGQAGRGHLAGLIPAGFASALQNLKPVSPKELFEWRRSLKDDNGRFHVWSWLLYHYLWNTRSKQLLDYQMRLSNGEDPARAWGAAFPEFDPARPDALGRLAKELDQYLHVPFLPYPVTADADAAFTDSPILPADVHLLLLDARAHWPEGQARDDLIRTELAEALCEDPAQAEALAWRADLDKTPAEPGLKKAVAARPGDWRAWLLLGEAMRGSDAAAEREAALRTAVTLKPDSARANHALAWQLVTTGRAREALTYANRALDLAPWDPSIIDTLAAVAASLGKCREALALEQRAADVMRADGSPEEAVQARLHEYEERCSGAGATSSPPRAPASQEAQLR